MKKMCLLILAILGSVQLMAIPGLGGSSGAGALINARNRGVQQDSQNNLKQIFTAITTYLIDNNDKLPASFSDLTQYTAGGKIFIAAFDHQSKAAASTIKPENTSFAYVGNIGRLPRNASDIPLAFEKPWLLPASQRFVVLLTADGQVQRVQITQLKQKTCKAFVELFLKDKKIDQNIKNKLIENATIEDKVLQKKKK